MISKSRVFNAALNKQSLTSEKWLTFDRNDELRDDGQDLGAALLEHVKSALNGEEAVRFVLFADSFEENWEVVVVVQLVNSHLPLHNVLHPV